MTCSGSPGTGMPHPPARSAGRDTEKSARPPSMSARTPQRRGVPGQPEEPVLLADLLRLGPVLGAAALPEFGRGVELLAARAVQAGVPPPVQVAGAGPPERLDAGPVPGVAAGADEVVDGQRQRAAECRERLGVAVDELP